MLHHEFRSEFSLITFREWASVLPGMRSLGPEGGGEDDVGAPLGAGEEGAGEPAVGGGLGAGKDQMRRVIGEVVVAWKPSRQAMHTKAKSETWTDEQAV